MASNAATSQVLDLERLERYTFGDPFLTRELLVLFERQCAMLLPVIVSAHDDRTRADSAHTLTGAARAVGAGRVAELAAAIETATVPDLARLAAELRLAVEEVRGAISARLDGAASRRRGKLSPTANASPKRAS